MKQLGRILKTAWLVFRVPVGALCVLGILVISLAIVAVLFAMIGWRVLSVFAPAMLDGMPFHGAALLGLLLVVATYLASTICISFCRFVAAQWRETK